MPANEVIRTVAFGVSVAAIVVSLTSLAWAICNLLFVLGLVGWQTKRLNDKGK